MKSPVKTETTNVQSVNVKNQSDAPRFRIKRSMPKNQNLGLGAKHVKLIKYVWEISQKGTDYLKASVKEVGTNKVETFSLLPNSDIMQEILNALDPEVLLGDDLDEYVGREMMIEIDLVKGYRNIVNAWSITSTQGAMQPIVSQTSVGEVDSSYHDMGEVSDSILDIFNDEEEEN